MFGSYKASPSARILRRTYPPPRFILGMSYYFQYPVALVPLLMTILFCCYSELFDVFLGDLFPFPLARLPAYAVMKR
jgi:hypothetical protein